MTMPTTAPNAEPAASTEMPPSETPQSHGLARIGRVYPLLMSVLGR